MANWNIKQSYDFNKVPGGAGYSCDGFIIYIRDMKKYKRESLQTLAADTRALILVFLPHGIVKVFLTLNSRRMVKSERQSFPFGLGGRTCFGFCSKKM